LETGRLIVDAFHYTTHRAQDILCHTWCNPAPTDGSQTDLLFVDFQGDGDIVLRRAFNSEAAEQLNAWLTSFEMQLKQMSDVSFDFFMHSILLIYKEQREKKLKKQGKDLLDSDIF